MTSYHYEELANSSLETLLEARRLLVDEISNYPGPVSGCDTQFNRLLSDRTRLSKAISVLMSQPF